MQDSEGRIVCIETIVCQHVTPVFVRGPDGTRNQIPPPISKGRKQSLIIENFANKKIFCIKNCGLIEEKLEKEIKIEELAKHSKKNDCWLALNGKVYDVTQYISQHPGGSVLLKAAGKDATQLFNKTHPWVSEMVYKKYYIGTLQKKLK